MEEAVVTSVEFPLQYTNVKFTFQNIGNHRLFVQGEGTLPEVGKMTIDYLIPLHKPSTRHVGNIVNVRHVTGNDKDFLR